MKKLLLLASLVVCVGAAENERGTIEFMDFAYMTTGVNTLSQVQVVNSSRENPHSRAIGVSVERPVTRPPRHRSRRAVFPHRALRTCSHSHFRPAQAWSADPIPN